MKSWITRIRTQVGPHLVLRRSSRVILAQSPDHHFHMKGLGILEFFQLNCLTSVPKEPIGLKKIHHIHSIEVIFLSSFSPYLGQIVNPSQLCYTGLIRGFRNQLQFQRTSTNECRCYRLYLRHLLDEWDVCSHAIFFSPLSLTPYRNQLQWPPVRPERDAMGWIAHKLVDDKLFDIRNGREKVHLHATYPQIPLGYGYGSFGKSRRGCCNEFTLR